MTHPHHLHARAALHSLATAWPHLLRAQRAARAAARENGDRGTLRSPTWSSARSGGGHSDVVLDAVARGGGVDDTYDRLADSTAATVRWLAAYLLDGHGDPDVAATLRMLVDALPGVSPRTSLWLARWITDEDVKVRKELRLGDDHQLLPGVECPACGSRRLATRDSSPDDRPVICEAGCTCDGDSCGCGMTMRVEGVAHIWTRYEMTTMTKAKGAA